LTLNSEYPAGVSNSSSIARARVRRSAAAAAWSRGRAVYTRTKHTHGARRLLDLRRAQYEIETRIVGAAKTINETLHTELERAATTARARPRSPAKKRDDDARRRRRRRRRWISAGWRGARARRRRRILKRCDRTRRLDLERARRASDD
jgi:hypothetical protein